ncbi:MAG TPA: hypothetical protein VI818_01045, partial [Candidatus Thermoplasmatota archaeon]|nr:hypothetical protein [Candidatus Thermoplasmatota archaeon]
TPLRADEGLPIERLRRLGITTVEDLCAADADAVGFWLREPGAVVRAWQIRSRAQRQVDGPLATRERPNPRLVTIDDLDGLKENGNGASSTYDGT